MDPRVKRARTIELRGDGDDEHSNASNEAFYENPVNSITELVDHLRSKREQFNESIERRNAFVHHVSEKVQTYRLSWQRWIGELDLNDTDAVNTLLNQLAYLWTSLHYLILIASPSEIALQQDARAVLQELLNLEHMVISLRRIMYPRNPTANFVINFDHYYYLQVAKDKKGLDARLAPMIVESLVCNELANRGFAVVIFTPEGRFSDGQHNQSDKDPRIGLYDRAYYVDNGIYVQTHFYGNVFDFRKFVYHVLSMHRIGNMTSSMNTAAEHFIIRTLRAPQTLQLYAPCITMQRIFMSFINGVYILHLDKFIPNNEPLPRTNGDATGVPYIFHNNMFTHVPDCLDHTEDFKKCKCLAGTPCVCTYPGLCTCGGVAPCRCVMPPVLQMIPTPALDALLAGQGWPLGVRLMMMAMLGRCLHSLHSLEEKLHLLPILYGVGGSGKSTFAQVVNFMLRSCMTRLYNDRTFIDTANLVQVLHNDSEGVIVVPGNDKALLKPHVHEIENKVEANFPFQNVLKDNLAVSATEIRRDSNFPQSALLKMAEGGQLEITNKNVRPVNVQWSFPMLLCLNLGQAPQTWTDDSGEMSRRVGVFMFEKRPDNVDPDLPVKLEREIANIILKCNKVYLAWAKFAQGQDIYGPTGAFQPAEYFNESRDKFIETINPCLTFWNYLISEKLIQFGPGYTATRDELLAQYKQYLTANANGAPPVITSAHRSKLEAFLRVNKGIRLIGQPSYVAHGFRFIHGE
jgi:hypothetical protein